MDCDESHQVDCSKLLDRRQRRRGRPRLSDGSPVRAQTAPWFGDCDRTVAFLQVGQEQTCKLIHIGVLVHTTCIGCAEASAAVQLTGFYVGYSWSNFIPVKDDIVAEN